MTLGVHCVCARSSGMEGGDGKTKCGRLKLTAKSSFCKVPLYAILGSYFMLEVSYNSITCIQGQKTFTFFHNILCTLSNFSKSLKTVSLKIQSL